MNSYKKHNTLKMSIIWQEVIIFLKEIQIKIWEIQDFQLGEFFNSLMILIKLLRIKDSISLTELMELSISPAKLILRPKKFLEKLLYKRVLLKMFQQTSGI